MPDPVAASTTVAPAIGLPAASRAVTVMVETPVTAVIDEGAAATLDCAAETAPTVTVTAAVWVTATPSIVAETVFISGIVERTVPVATPLASVGPTGCVSTLPDPVAASTTVAPAIGLPATSRAVTVIVATPAMAGMDAGTAWTLDRVAETAPTVTVTEVV